MSLQPQIKRRFQLLYPCNKNEYVIITYYTCNKNEYVIITYYTCNKNVDI
jgi:hypothetical protein